MVIALTFLIGTALSWVMLLIIIPIARKLADFSMPPWSQALWKLAVVAAVVNAIEIGLDPVNGWLSWIVSAIAFWVLMVKWFDVDFFGAVIIVVVTAVVRTLVITLLMALLVGLL